MTVTRVRALAALVVLALLGAGCRGGDARPVPAAAGHSPGVSAQPCPDAVNPGNGCVYLGAISDLTRGPFRALGAAFTQGQQAFWRRVNEQGGIGGYDVDVVTHVRDSHYEADTHSQEFDAIRGEVLALAQSLGSPQTQGILGALRTDHMVAVPASSTSAWAFDDEIVESGASYCVEMANALDWYARHQVPPASVLAVHFTGHYGDDAAAGAAMAAERMGVRFETVATTPGQQHQQPVIDLILAERPDLVVISTGPAELATIAARVHAGGFTGTLIGSSPSWNRGLMNTPAREALEALYFHAAPWAPWDGGSGGHAAVRDALAGEVPDEAALAGWVSQYPLKAALETALAEGPLTRTALLQAVRSLKAVDYEGILPMEAGNFAGGAPAAVFRQSTVSRADVTRPTGLRLVADLFTGPTAAAMPFDEPCFQRPGLTGPPAEGG